MKKQGNEEVTRSDVSIIGGDIITSKVPGLGDD
jgi:hypothetical protein